MYKTQLKCNISYKKISIKIKTCHFHLRSIDFSVLLLNVFSFRYMNQNFWGFQKVLED